VNEKGEPRGASGAPGRGKPENREPGKPHKAERESSLFRLLLDGVALCWGLLKTPGAVSTMAGESHYPEKGDQTGEKRDREAGASLETARSADRNLDLESRWDLRARERWGTLWVVFALLASAAGGVGFVVAYWTGGNNLLLGGTFALCLAGLGSALVLWAHWLTVHKEAVEPREVLSSPDEERLAFDEEFITSNFELHRRRLLKWVTATAVAMAAAVFITFLRSLGANPGLYLFTRVWKRGQRLLTEDGKPVSVDQLTPGSTVVVYPEDGLGTETAQTVLLRVDPALLQLPKERANWAPKGNLAFSRVCTHAGCSVGMYEKSAHLLMCPCHQSTFDVLRGAEPTAGPAARPLPQLPLYADGEGMLCAGGGFSQPPGPGFWGIPS
jgi:quinol---cytochrome c reductase iron-sulfur subunit